MLTTTVLFNIGFDYTYSVKKHFVFCSTVHKKVYEINAIA